MDKHEPFMLRGHDEVDLDDIEKDQGRLRRILADVLRLLREANELIDQHRRVNH